jgi:hypothetical protein
VDVEKARAHFDRLDARERERAFPLGAYLIKVALFAGALLASVAIAAVVAGAVVAYKVVVSGG